MNKVYYRRVGDEAVVYQSDSRFAHLLNTPMREVFDGHGRFTAEELAEKLYPKLDRDQAIALVEVALDELADAGLVASETRRSRCKSRRDFIADIGKMAVAVPVLTTCLMPEPAAAQSVAVTCASSSFAVFPVGAENPDPGGGAAASPVINAPIVSTICIPTGATTVSLVATNSNAGITGSPSGLEFDEDVTFSVVSPNLNANSVSYGSFQNCSGSQVNVAAGSASFNISALFQTGGGGIFEPGDYTLTIIQCNSSGRSAVRGFNIDVS